MIVMPFRRVALTVGCIAFCLALTNTVAAQNMSSEAILEQLKTRAANLDDATFLMRGVFTDPISGESTNIEMEFQLITAHNLLRSYFIEPAALLDNFIIVDGENETVYNYLFTTNQVTIFSLRDPDAFGGLFPNDLGGLSDELEDELESSQTLNLSLDPDRLFASWELQVQGYRNSEAGSLYDLRFDNLDDSVDLSHVNASVFDERWTPERLEFVNRDGDILGYAHFSQVRLDQGLDPEELRFIPFDAELIDER